KRLDLKSSCPISREDVKLENEKLALCDGIFCPSPMVRKSLIMNDVPEDKLLSTSYGWDPSRFPGRNKRPDNGKRPTFLFVGTLCVRKGIPLLLKAWKKAAIDGELILCGGIDGEIQTHFADLLEGKNIRYMPYTTDIGELYSQADVFVFPTLEEGGPMVTYEAMAHSIPVLVTQMGAGAIARNGEDSIILPDNDVDAWALAFRKLASDTELRLKLGRTAELRAREFTWEETAAKRATLLKDKFPSLWR
ncbi:MAG: glycosyltransferase family 4 protein, partial [Thermodesulfobacteriota bacterium]